MADELDLFLAGMNEPKRTAPKESVPRHTKVPQSLGMRPLTLKWNRLKTKRFPADQTAEIDAFLEKFHPHAVHHVFPFEGQIWIIYVVDTNLDGEEVDDESTELQLPEEP